MKIDPHKHKERYEAWKEKISNGIPNISDENSHLIINYIFDMENGLNVSNKSQKGARSYTRLNNLRQRMIFLAKLIKEHLAVNNISRITEEELLTLFNNMRNGGIRRINGGKYKSVADYVKVFKAFWHWHTKVSRKHGLDLSDITQDLDTSREKPKWVYLTEEEVKRLCDNASFDYRVLIMFLYDSGIRSPTELMNIKVSDLYNDYKEMMIRDEISKTFGRRIKLLLSSDFIKDYIKAKQLEEDDFIFQIYPSSVNKYLQRLAKRVLGEGKSPAGKKYSELTMYHFRHCSCCYWLPRYKSESALKYRFGWKKSDKIHYYSELLGMRDTISEDDLLVDVTKTEIEQRLIKSERSNEIMKDENEQIKIKIEQIENLIRLIEIRISN